MTLLYFVLLLNSARLRENTAGSGVSLFFTQTLNILHYRNDDIFHLCTWSTRYVEENFFNLGISARHETRVKLKKQGLTMMLLLDLEILFRRWQHHISSRLCAQMRSVIIEKKRTRTILEWNVYSLGHYFAIIPTTAARATKMHTRCIWMMENQKENISKFVRCDRWPYVPLR